MVPREKRAEATYADIVAKPTGQEDVQFDYHFIAQPQGASPSADRLGSTAFSVPNPITSLTNSKQRLRGACRPSPTPRAQTVAALAHV